MVRFSQEYDYMLPYSQMLNSFSSEERVNIVKEDLKTALEGLAVFLFGDVEMRWSPDYFPFTDPSLQLEIKFRVSWWFVRYSLNKKRQGKT